MKGRFNEVLRLDGGYVFSLDALPLGRILGGVSARRKERFLLRGSGEGRVSSSLMEIGVIVNSPVKTRWRLWLDGISLTREFNPNFSLALNNNVYASMIFDVTPIMRRDSSKTRHRVLVLNEGSDPFLLTHAVLLNVSETKGVSGSLLYCAGGILLGPGETEDLRPGLSHHGESGLTFFSYASTLPAVLSIRINDAKDVYHEQNNIVDIVEVKGLEDRLDMVRLTNESITPLSRGGWILIPNLMVFSRKKIEEEVSVEHEELSVQDGQIRLSIRVKNTGTLPLKNLLLVILSSGMPLRSLNIGDLDPGEEKKVVESFKPYSESRSIVYRIIWRRLGETKFIERRHRII